MLQTFPVTLVLVDPNNDTLSRRIETNEICPIAITNPKATLDLPVVPRWNPPAVNHLTESLQLGTFDLDESGVVHQTIWRNPDKLDLPVPNERNLLDRAA